MIECSVHKKLDRLRKELVMPHFLNATPVFAGVAERKYDKPQYTLCPDRNSKRVPFKCRKYFRMNHLGQFYSLDPVIYEEQIPHARISVSYLILPRNISTKARIGLQLQGKIYIFKRFRF